MSDTRTYVQKSTNSGDEAKHVAYSKLAIEK